MAKRKRTKGSEVAKDSKTINLVLTKHTLREMDKARVRLMEERPEGGGWSYTKIGQLWMREATHDHKLQREAEGK